jgi:hypothetical protein
MSSTLNQMYGNITDQQPSTLLRQTTSNIQSLGRYLQLQIDNQQVLIVNPQIVDSLINTVNQQEKIILDLRDRLIRLQQQCTQQQSRISRLENQPNQGGIFD